MSRAGDESFVAFVNERSPELMRLALHLTSNPEQAKDLVQTALERAYRKWSRVDPDNGSAYGYVRQTMINAHTDGLRSTLRWRRRSGMRETERDVAMSDGEVQWVAPAGQSPEAMALNRDTVTRSLGLLTARERAAVVLRYGEDLPEAEVAHQLGVTVGTVKSTVSRALAKMRVHEMAPHLGGIAR